jgi:hypothetical protein
MMFVSLDLNRKNINRAISDNMLRDLRMNTNDFNYGQTACHTRSRMGTSLTVA